VRCFFVIADDIITDDGIVIARQQLGRNWISRTWVADDENNNVHALNTNIKG